MTTQRLVGGYHWCGVKHIGSFIFPLIISLLKLAYSKNLVSSKQSSFTDIFLIFLVCCRPSLHTGSTVCALPLQGLLGLLLWQLWVGAEARGAACNRWRRCKNVSRSHVSCLARSKMVLCHFRGVQKIKHHALHNITMTLYCKLVSKYPTLLPR